MSRFAAFGGILKLTAAGVAAGITAFTVTAKCSSPGNWENRSSINVPDYGPKWDFNWDRREPYNFLRSPKPKKASKEDKTEAEETETIDKYKPKATRHIILIRHGQYDLEGEGDEGKKLTEIGKKQAQVTGQRLKELGLDYSCFFVSNMKRALETAEIIEKELCLPAKSFSMDPILREGPPVPPEPPVIHWNPQPHEFYEEGPRIEAAFRKYIHRAEPTQEKDSYEVIVCHANVIRYFVCRSLQFPAEAWLRITLNNGSITRISVLPSGRVVLRGVSEAGHFAPDLLTYT